MLSRFSPTESSCILTICGLFNRVKDKKILKESLHVDPVYLRKKSIFVEEQIMDGTVGFCISKQCRNGQCTHWDYLDLSVCVWGGGGGGVKGGGEGGGFIKGLK